MKPRSVRGEFAIPLCADMAERWSSCFRMLMINSAEHGPQNSSVELLFAFDQVKASLGGPAQAR
jgi:hypothetical protein